MSECNLFDLGWIFWPLEFHTIKKIFAGKDETIFIIPEHFNRCLSFVAKDERTAVREGIQLKPHIYNRGQARCLLSKICAAACQVDMCGIFYESAQHLPSSWLMRTAASIASSSLEIDICRSLKETRSPVISLLF